MLSFAIKAFTWSLGRYVSFLFIVRLQPDLAEAGSFFARNCSA